MKNNKNFKEKDKQLSMKIKQYHKQCFFFDFTVGVEKKLLVFFGVEFFFSQIFWVEKFFFAFNVKKQFFVVI